MREVFQITRHQRYGRSHLQIGVVPGIKATPQTGQKRHQRRDDSRQGQEVRVAQCYVRYAAGLDRGYQAPGELPLLDGGADSLRALLEQGGGLRQRHFVYLLRKGIGGQAVKVDSPLAPTGAHLPLQPLITQDVVDVIYAFGPGNATRGLVAPYTNIRQVMTNLVQSQPTHNVFTLRMTTGYGDLRE